ncbi:MAG: M23 family metallopeptidase, partial [Leptolinea sp.]|nr:M23 family metallopeptidase [Leptolinea sp.]
MTKQKNSGAAFSRWIIPVLICVFLILAAGTAYVAYQYFFGEPTAEQVFPKYSQPKDLATAELERQLQKSIQRHEEVLAFLMYRVAITNVTYSDDKKTALLWLALYDKDTDVLVPAEPGLAIAQRSNDQSWIVTVQPDEGFNKLLLAIPESMIDTETKEQYLSKPQSITKAVALRGYRLPWKKGVTKFLTGSIGHVLTYKSCPSSCLYAFDFADGGNFPILASKGGRVKYAVWKYPDNNHSNANYIILEDDTTNPTTYQVYFHLSQDSIPEALRVKGTWVNQGQFIGNVDNTGYSTGPHLHFHVHANATSYWGNSVDIIFEDVAVNGGRPRTCAEAKAFPSYGSECIPGDRYLSQNGDSK